MAHFAKLDENNIVIYVVAGRDEDNGKEDELTARTGNTYKQTSYNTKGGIHYDPITRLPSEDQTKAYRKNYACLGYTYDAQRDAFIPPQPFPSWTLDEQTCWWISPVPMPDDAGPRKQYIWDEASQSWVEVTNGN